MQPSSAGSFSITPSVRKEIVKIIDARIAEAHVTKEDFSELKSIVKDLAEAQKRTEVKVEALATDQRQLAAAVKELAAEQKQTAAAVKELAASQKEMQAAITKLAIDQKETRTEVGGLARSMSYAFENETYRFLPAALQEKYGITVQEKIMRAEIDGQEVNLFCRAERDGRQVLIVGESKLQLVAKRLQKKPNVFDALEEKVEAVRSEHGDKEIVKVLVTHYADKAFLRKAQELDVIVVQSYEW